MRRANQEATRTPITGGSSLGQSAGAKAAPSHDREATARALDPNYDLQPAPAILPDEAPNPRPAVTDPVVSRPAGDQPGVSVRAKAQPAQSQVQTVAPASGVVTPSQAPSTGSFRSTGEIGVLDPIAAPYDLDDLDPLDYLTAEVRKVDQALARELAQDSAASLFTRFVSGLVDIMVIAVSTVPFLVLIEVANGNLTNRSTETVGIGVIVLLSFFYFAFTQCLCGKTFGMMVTNTHIVDASSKKTPPITRLLLRTIGIFVALAPAGLGLLWAVVDKKRRGWQDLVSGTIVISDF